MVATISAAISPIIRIIVGASAVATAGAGAYDLYKANDPQLYQDLESMLRSKGYLKAD